MGLVRRVAEARASKPKSIGEWGVGRGRRGEGGRSTPLSVKAHSRATAEAAILPGLLIGSRSMFVKAVNSIQGLTGLRIRAAFSREGGGTKQESGKAPGYVRYQR
jgi:hypothetical protein